MTVQHSAPETVRARPFVPARPAGGAAGGDGGPMAGQSDPAVPVLPRPRGPLSAAVVEALAGGPPTGGRDRWRGALADAASADPYGEDVQMALHVCFELHYRGFAGVEADWEWDPGLLELRGALEARFLAALRADTGVGGEGADAVEEALEELLVEPVDGDGVSHHLRDAGERWQLREYAALRSVYHLKEADPHAWVIPRLRGRAKTALVAVENDEFGGGREEMIHAGLYAGLLEDLGLDASYGGHVDAAPAQMLATVNMMSLFGLRRSLRAAMVGHFAAAEITTAPSARRMARALERLGGGPRALLFYTEHIEADAVHEQVLRHEVIGGLLEGEPELASDVVLGVRATGLLEERLAEHVLGCWRAEPARSALLRPLDDGPEGPAGDPGHGAGSPAGAAQVAGAPGAPDATGAPGAATEGAAARGGAEPGRGGARGSGAAGR